ncbi:MAG: phage minor head protein [Candidatus Absconditicoccaceae bacterium]
MSRLTDLKKLEAKRKRKMQLLLLGILMSIDSEDELAPKTRQMSSDVLEEIKDIRKASFAIADKYSEEQHRVLDNRKLIIASAALYVVSHVIRRIAISDKPTFAEKVKEAMRGSEPIIERLTVSEIYQANVAKMIANHPKQMLIWNAVNDGKTCSRCRSLDGKEFLAGDAPEYPHSNCRCVVDFKG